MENLVHHPLVVIGAGAGGLVVAIGAAKARKKVLLIEKGRYGGDCTNFGCIPSKSLIASGEKARSLLHSAPFGLDYIPPRFDASGCLARVRNTIQTIRKHEEPEELEKMGVNTLMGTASFTSSHTLCVTTAKKSVHISADKIVLATGSYPFIPPIEGLTNTPYMTNETIFDLETIPKQLIIMGAGPIGCELAQVFQRLGSQVTLIESMRGLLPNEEPEVSQEITRIFAKEGISMYFQCSINTISHKQGMFTVCVDTNRGHKEIKSEHLLVATGRRPNTDDLQLDNARIKYSEQGIAINKYGETSTKHIFAIGDVTGAPFFTHKAENQGRSVLTSLLLLGSFKKKLNRQPIPRCIYTSPEVASIGLTEAEAKKREKEKSLKIYTVPLREIDRAITMNTEEGFLKVITKKWSSRILGATVMSPRAGEILPELSLAMLYRIPLRKLARLIHPYPTYNAAIRKAADLWLTETILSLFKGKA